MKKVLFFIVLLFTVSAVSSCIFVSGTESRVETKEELPEAVMINGRHVNVGVMHERLSMFWIPVRSTTEYALISDDGRNVYPLNKSSIRYLKEQYNIDIDPVPCVSFWNKIGGKLIRISK
ncbi:MAG: hypothetical protein LBF89_01200 [Bacteroidales bacterium]|jgi:hypothetical protein|nr:hypothetical protein [Bacteroidales bacterium]